MGIGTRVIAPTTAHGERSRQQDAEISASPGPTEGIRRCIGIVDAVHETNARLVKAHTPDGVPIGNSGWIELNHSASEIVERWGTIRPGFKIRVTSTGAIGMAADATVIGTEDEGTNDQIVPNEADKGVGDLFGA
jgi:hypothetical protein